MNNRRLKLLQVTPASCNAFTLIELVTIAGVIGILACLSFPAMARAKGQSRRTQCTANLRQFALAEHVYGAEFKDKLPLNRAGNWQWDTDWYIGVRLESYGQPWWAMYCPGTAPRFSNQDNRNLYNFAPGMFHVLGYAATFPGTPVLIATNANASLTPQAITNGVIILPPPLPSRRVLVADATISQYGQTSDVLRYTYNWSSIFGGYGAHTSPHLVGPVPSGGNQAMLDGHVEWRKFDDMQCRTINSSSAEFWW